MEIEYTETVPVDDTVVFESPVKDLRGMYLDTNTEEVLDVCGYVPDSEDQFENYGETDIVLDSEDENVVTPDCVRGTRRLSGTMGSLQRRQTPTGYFRRLGSKIDKRGFLHRVPTRNTRSGEESNASKTSLDNASRKQDHIVSVGCVISRLPDKQRTPEPENVNQENLEMVEKMTKDSIDKKHLSENRVMESDADLENVKLNQDESTEPVESQSKALDFVDQYLTLNDLGSFGDVEEAKQINRIRSPPSLSSKGSLCLARKINLGFSENKYANFDWVENPIENEGCTFSKTRKVSSFGFKGDKHEHSSVSKESGNVNAHNAQYEVDAQMDAFDVGLDTQMAAEAMQSLMNSPLPSFNAQQSSNTLDSAVYRRCRFKGSAIPREAFTGWKNKCKRSKGVTISTRKAQMKGSAQLPVSEGLTTNTLLSRSDFNIPDLRFARNSNLENSSDMIKSNTPQERRKLVDDHDDVSKLEFSQKCLNLNSDSSSPVTADKMKEGKLSTDVAHNSDLSKLNKKARLPRSKRPCYPIVPGDENKAQTGLLVYNRRRKRSVFVPRIENNAPSGFIVYNRRRKCSSERKHSGSSPNVSGSPSPIHIDIDAAEPSNQLRELKNVNFSSSVDNSGSKKLNELLNGNYSTLQVCELRYRNKYQRKHPFRSHETKELARLGHLKSLPSFLPKDSRKRRAMEKVCVLFSQNLDRNILKKQKKIVERLGFSIASCYSDATHFVADRFMRTRNMMEAIALGKPVVTHLWLESCDQAGYFIDEKNFILRDEKKEKEIGFSMPLTLARASRHSLLKFSFRLTDRVFITRNVKPSVDVITCLVRAVQCQVVQNILGAESKNGTIPHDLLILSSVEDYKICMPFLEKGASIYDSELLLNGIITQKLDYERHQIFKDFAESRSLCFPQRRKISNSGRAMTTTGNVSF